MKKKLPLILPIILVFLLFCGFTEDQKVFDLADLLSDSEETALQDRCIELAYTLEMDIVLLTTDDAEGRSAMQVADDFYDEGGFGYDMPQGDGVLFLIDMDNRDIWISTCGWAISELDDYTIDQMLDNIFPNMPEADYYGAMVSFLDNLEDYKAIKEPYQGQNGYNPPKPSNETDFYVDDGHGGYEPAYQEPGFNHLLALVAAVVIAIVIVVIMVKGAGGSKSVTAAHYLNHAAVRMNHQADLFVNKTVTVRHIPPPDSGGGGGGGSSSHTSSSGVSHGGGGRSF